MSLLSATQLTCIKRDRTLFADLNFAIASGQLVHLIGENGAGKTSLMRILAGLSMPTSGEVRFEDVPLSEMTSVFANGSLYIGHKASINGSLTAVENTQFWLAQQGLQLDSKQVDKVFLHIGLAGLEDVPCNSLSAGQQRRVALARLWLKKNSRLWFLDEPFTALDFKGIDLVNAAIQEFCGRGGAVLLTSHQALPVSLGATEFQLEYRF